MAVAKFGEIEAVVVAPGITLTITEEEASALRAVLQHVAGRPNKTRRGLVQRVDNALREIGVRVGADDITGGSLWFLDPASPVEPF